METTRSFVSAAAAPLIVGLAGLFAQPAHADQTYIATLSPLNSKVAGRHAEGDLRLTVSGDTVTIDLDARDVPPGIMHMAHLHGYVSGKNSTCPGAGADTNHDGIIDLAETEPAAGVTMIPLNAAPADLTIASDSYPTASKDGRITYKQQLSLRTLMQKMAGDFDGAAPDLAKRVIFVHGVDSASSLPKTVASLPGVPAQATLPIACGKLTLGK
ncbi:MAG TPA: hypothetical protein VFS06_16055 [Casimicrobiaceae bacterium]|jgi:hypothetical protein|nr:hypothetical protein [Casimicrobiaceae bacterium]